MQKVSREADIHKKKISYCVKDMNEAAAMPIESALRESAEGLSEFIVLASPVTSAPD